MGNLTFYVSERTINILLLSTSENILVPFMSEMVLDKYKTSSGLSLYTS